MTVSEALEIGKTELAGDLAAGVNTLSLNQTVTFTKYVKLVLPLDGYVFWVKADLVATSAIANVMGVNTTSAGQSPIIATNAYTFDAKGSMHVVTEKRRVADAAYTVNRMVFTSLGPINHFNEVGPNCIWLGEFEGKQFAFSSRKSFYQQSGLYHYVGDANYSVIKTQVINSLAALQAKALIVSNSLPLWLAMNNWDQQPWEPFGNPLTLYPGFLSKDNLVPPFGTIDVRDTSGLAVAPRLGKTYSHSQQVRDRVRVTLWGLDNDSAMEFVDFVDQYSLNTNAFGIANVPVANESTFLQVELDAIAKKKVIDYEINYHQRSARDVARQLILKCVPKFIFST